MKQSNQSSILFIIPPHLQIEDFIRPAFNARTMARESGNKFGAVLTDMPLGPLSMSAYLKDRIQDVDVRILDFNVELNLLESWDYEDDSFKPYFKDVLLKGLDRRTGQSWRDFNPAVIGSSILFGPSYENMLDIIAVSREVFPTSLLLAGGGIATTMYKKIFEDSPEIDAIGFTECEIPMVELMQAVDRYKHLDEDKAWITRSKSALPRGDFSSKYVWDLDEIPFYDYGIVNKEDYSLNPALTAYAGVYEKANNFHYMTSRGCPYRCNFCASHKVNGREMRYHSIQRVEADLRRLRDLHGAKTIVIQDDNFMGQGEAGRLRALEIVRLIGGLGLSVVFQNSLTLVSVTDELLEEMKRANVTQLLLSVESGSAKSLKRMHKPLRLDDIERVAKTCRRLGIYTDCNILIGNIFEVEEDIQESLSFLKSGRCPADWFKIFITTPLPGSELYDQAVSEGYVGESVINLDFKKSNINRPELTSDRLEFLQYYMNLDLNFLNNNNFRIAEELFHSQGLEMARRNYELALLGFESAVKAKDNHLLGHYYAMKVHERLGNSSDYEHHRGLVLQSMGDQFWAKWIAEFPDFRENLEALAAVHPPLGMNLKVASV